MKILDVIKKILVDTMTTPDNTKFCPVRITFFVAIGTYIGFTVFHPDKFTWIEWSSGMAILMSAGAGGSFLKDKN
jgi:hypothetical protein